MHVIDTVPMVAAPASAGAGTYLDWWVVHISVANLLVIVLMVVTFVAALLLPFPGGSESGPSTLPSADSDEREGRR